VLLRLVPSSRPDHQDVCHERRANAGNASDTVASALRELAGAVAGLDDWHLIRDWALKGGGEFHIPPQLSKLDTYRAPGTVLAADERLGALPATAQMCLLATEYGYRGCLLSPKTALRFHRACDG